MSEESVGAVKRPVKKAAKKTAPKHEITGLDPNFDLDAWISGTTGITATARIIKRGDLVGERQRLQEELRAAKQLRAHERAVGDRAPESVQEDLDRVEAEIWESSLVVTMQDRTSDHRNEIRAQAVEDLELDLKEEPEWSTTVLALVEIADSIIRVETADGRELPLPAGGFGWERLQQIREQSGEAALLELADRYHQMKSNSPAVQAPFSLSSSSGRGGGTSRRSSGPRGRGGSGRS